MSKEYPDYFARFYDLIYHQLRNETDHDFFMNEIQLINGKVLDIGTGTGRFFNEALNNGVDIFGLDLSKPMLSVLKSKLQSVEHHRLSLQNMIDFDYNFKFDLIVAPFRVFMHLLSVDEQLAALNNIFKHLKPGGKFIFDVFIPDLNQLIKGLENHVDFDEEYENGQRFKRTVSTSPDLVRQLINILFKFEWGENGIEQKKEWNLSLRYFFRFELEHLLHRSMFDDFEIFGDYQHGEIKNTSKEFVVFCRKAKIK